MNTTSEGATIMGIIECGVCRGAGVIAINTTNPIEEDDTDCLACKGEGEIELRIGRGCEWSAPHRHGGDPHTCDTTATHVITYIDQLSIGSVDAFKIVVVCTEHSWEMVDELYGEETNVDVRLGMLLEVCS